MTTVANGPSFETDALPLVSVVTASLNMGAYIEETITSVLTQDYSRIEYIVMDGGSTDGTLEILKRYDGRLRYQSEHDGGTADAVNKGFALARGSVLAFLNADDTYLPGAIAAAVSELRTDGKIAAVYGEANWVDERGEEISRYPTHPFNRELLQSECFICQPTAFFRRSVFEEVGKVNAKLHYAFDYDLWIRIAQRHEMRKINRLLATSRLHRTNKTLGERGRALKETMLLLKDRYGYVPLSWIVAYCSHLLGEKFELVPQISPSQASCGLSLPVGLFMNRQHPVQYLKDWQSLYLGALNQRLLRRRLRTEMRDRQANDR